ncbi:ECF transporter S component [Lactococcus nasutitermitis]|uniref:Riboflavin transporter n=1 Tax=Lactococcus nasutitermitis TaxID=1652957 RepID=A0ABV9JGY7_9LACT|nr:ECF transporter S component [Lactococcus nasutitermitis]
MTNTRKLTMIALLSAISFVLSFQIFQFPLIPTASFLKIDFTILPILIGLFMFGLSSAFTILIIRSILWLLLDNQGVNTWIGLPMNFVAVAVFVVILWIFLRKKFSLKNYILAAVVGTLALTAVMLLLNYVYAIPLYSKFANFDIATMFPGGVNAYLVAVILFNLIEGAIYAVSFVILYWALRGSKVVKFINAEK